MDIIKMYLVTFSTFRQHIAHKLEFCPILSTSVVKKCFSFMLKFKAKSWGAQCLAMLPSQKAQQHMLITAVSGQRNVGEFFWLLSAAFFFFQADYHSNVLWMQGYLWYSILKVFTVKRPVYTADFYDVKCFNFLCIIVTYQHKYNTVNGQSIATDRVLAGWVSRL